MKSPQTLEKTTGSTLILEAPKQLSIKHYEEAAVAPDEVHLKTFYSGISSGTKLTAYRGATPI